MIDTSHQLAPAPKRLEKRLNKENHANDIKKIHERGAELMPAEYLVCHQSDPDLAHKIRAQAKQRIAMRNAKRLANRDLRK
jgi:hypothetical protein